MSFLRSHPRSLFLGTANSLRGGGPLGLWLGYSVMGSIVFAVMTALGEMIAHLPISGGHIALARRFVSPEMAFAVGWLYWYNWTIVLRESAQLLNTIMELTSYLQPPSCLRRPFSSTVCLATCNE